MKIFKLDKKYSIVCEWQNTRNGFRHVAILHLDGKEIYRTKKTYINRTWESFEFESVLIKLVDDYFSDNDLGKKYKQKYKNVIKKYGKNTRW